MAKRKKEIKDINLKINWIAEKLFNDNNSALAEILGTNEANIRNYRAGTEPKASFIKDLITKLEINFEWLFFDVGDAKKKRDNVDAISTGNTELGVHIPNNLIQLLNKIEEEQENINANLSKVRTALEEAGLLQSDKQLPADAAKPIGEIREEYASGELGKRNKRNVPEAEKDLGKKK